MYNGIPTLGDYGDIASREEMAWLRHAQISNCDLHPFYHSLLLIDRKSIRELKKTLKNFLNKLQSSF